MLGRKDRSAVSENNNRISKANRPRPVPLKELADGYRPKERA